MKTGGIFLTIIILLVPISVTGQSRYAIGLGGGLATLNGGSRPWQALDPNYVIKLDAGLANRWRLGIDFSYFKIYSDSTARSEFQFGSDAENRVRAWKGYDLAFIFYRRIYPSRGSFGLSGGLGLGLSFWEMVDPVSGELLKTEGERGEQINFSANEVFVASRIGLEYDFKSRLKFGLDVNINYLTGGGREFSQTVKDGLGHWNLKSGIYIAYQFGGSIDQRKPEPTAQYLAPRWEEETERPIPTEIGPTRMIDPNMDSDQDGIPDTDDICLGTPAAALGMIDTRGCPVDTDCDGIPDFLDKCRHNPVGAKIDANGCPVDSDNDGVFDGLDDCPQSQPGLPVNKSGCLDLTIFEKPMILNIKYYSGSFEFDRETKVILDDVVKMLLRAPDIKVEINGYTDNIGTDEANRQLSQKRANRVRDYLVEQGIDTKRLIANGKGETNSITSNDTREGRQKNRRVELVFFR
nr:OmpA family protein [candidate division Zixibacteria bacterium]